MSELKTPLLNTEEIQLSAEKLLTEAGKKASSTTGSNIHIYKRRWYVLVIFGLFCGTQNFVWNTWGPISTTSEEAFGWHDSTIAWLSNWGPISYILSGLFFPWLLQTKGLRVAVSISMALVAGGAMCRVVPSQSSSSHRTLMIHFGQFLNGLAGPIAMGGTTDLSATWFPPHERVTATAISSSISNLGAALSFIIGPQFVINKLPARTFPNSFNLRIIPASGALPSSGVNKTVEAALLYRQGVVEIIMSYLQYSCVWAMVILVLILLYFPARPPHPPGITATMDREEYFDGLRSLSGKSQFWVVAFVYGTSLGVLFCWGTVLNVNLQPVHISEEECGWIGFYSILVGCFVSLLVGRFADYFSRRMKYFILVLYFLGSLCFLVFALMLVNILPFSKGGVAASIILGSTLLNAACPLMFELACELAYPTGEGTTNGIMALINNIGGLLFLGTFAIPNIGTMWMNWTLVLSTAVCIPIIFRLRESYNRLDMESSVTRKLM